MHFSIAIGLALAVLSSPVAAACDKSNAQWVSEGKTRYVLYGTQGVDYLSHLFIEEWREGQLAWRGRGRVTCSLGVIVCYALMSMDSPPSDGQPATTMSVVEVIDENDDGLPEWVVFAGLAQQLFGNGGLKVKWFNGFKPDGESPDVVAPNIYKLDGCRPPRQKGGIYGVPELCAAYRRDGSLTPDPIFGTSDGTWWMDDTVVVGQDGSCDILDKDSDGTIVLACGWGADEEETRKYREVGQTRYLNDIALTVCKP